MTTQKKHSCLTDTRSIFVLLDIGTGGGEKLARLAPLGVRIAPIANHSSLPFADCQFDVVINRHEEFCPSEVARILNPGGRFITQQVGERNNHELTDFG